MCTMYQGQRVLSNAQASRPQPDRSNIRIPPAQKALIARAAPLTPKDMSDFILDKVVAKARALIAEAQAVRVFDRDFAPIFELLDHLRDRMPGSRPRSQVSPTRYDVALMARGADCEVAYRACFDCGDVHMNEFLRRFARQSHEKNAANTLCAIDAAAPGRILGFYTIAPSAVEHEQVPARMTRGLGAARSIRLQARLARDRPDSNGARARRPVAGSCGSALLTTCGGGGRHPHDHRCQERPGRALVRELRRRAVARQPAHIGDAARNFRGRPRIEGLALASNGTPGRSVCPI
jgi:uncharacterized protein (DUF1778 family)